MVTYNLSCGKYNCCEQLQRIGDKFPAVIFSDTKEVKSVRI